MKTIKIISHIKLRNDEIIVQPKEKNNNKNESQFIDAAKYMIYLEAFLGINRLYLIQCPNIVKILGHIYSFALILTTICFLIFKAPDGTVFVYISTKCVIVEYIVLIIISLTTGSLLKKQIPKNSIFCEMLKINDGSIIAASIKKPYAWLGICAIYNIFEVYLIYNIFLQYISDAIYKFVVMFIHDFEFIFLTVQIRHAYLKLLLIKAHVRKMFGEREKDMKYKKLSEIELQSLKVEIDLKTLHNTYSLLSKYSKKFNNCMNVVVSDVLYL